jgi:hypothetical protein
MSDVNENHTHVINKKFSTRTTGPNFDITMFSGLHCHDLLRVVRIRILTEHESTGLEIYGIPYESEPLQPRERPRRNSPMTEVLLGTTPPGDDTWLETLCSNPDNRPIREIQLKRTGRKASYLRINDIEVTYMTPAGPMKEVFNKSARTKLYYDSVFRLILPRPMKVIRIRILTGHESTGLRVYGIY